jgi:hypothetical protein
MAPTVMPDTLPRSPTVRVFIFSGRPDPEFKLDGADVADLLARLSRIPLGQRPEAIEAVQPPPPQLGYRGLLVRLPDSDLDQLLVYGGVIRFRRDGRQHSWRDTVGIERGLLEEAARRGHQGALESVGVSLDPPEPTALRAAAGSS